jgi:hypothetical protein
MSVIRQDVLQKRITQASKKGSTYLRRSSESFAEPRDLGFAEASEEVCSISFLIRAQPAPGCATEAERCGPPLFSRV